MDQETLAQALVPVPTQEHYVRSGFGKKIRAVIAKVPFGADAVAAYMAAIDPATPARVKGILFAALAYFVLPADLIPDFLLGLGFTDDATVLLAAIQVLSPHITDAHRARAEAFLSEPAAELPDCLAALAVCVGKGFLELPDWRPTSWSRTIHG